MQSKQIEILEAADKVFNSVLKGNLNEEDPELRAVPEFNDLSRREPEPDADEATVRSIINGSAKEWTEKLEKGEFKITTIEHTNYGPDSEILSQINEQTYSISYRSNFGDISTEIERTVDPLAQGDDPLDANGRPIERTISAAIAKSMPGDTILVKSGEYNESIVLDRSIQIKRFDDTSNVELNSVKGDAICLRTNCARIVGIKISCATPGDTYCVRSKIGILELEGCVLVSRCAGCVRLEHNARISAKDCELHTNMFTATSLMPGSKAIFDNCIFERPDGERRDERSNAGVSIPCITIDSDATCIVVNSKKIESSILFKPHSKGMIKGSTITAFTHGVIVQDSAQPLITGCTIQGCQRGLSLEGRSLGVFLDNKIARNEVGVFATGVRNFIMRDNIISASNTIGVRIAKGSYCTFEGGAICNSGHNGIQLDNRAQVTMKNVSLSENLRSGLIVESRGAAEEESEEAFAKLINCTVAKNHDFGISIRSGLHFSMVGGKVRENNAGGIRVDGCKLELTGVEAVENLGKEVMLFGHSEIVATDCIFGNRPLAPGQAPADLRKEEQQGASVSLRDVSTGKLSKCQWIGLTSMRSVFVTNEAQLTVSGCKFTEVNVGILVQERSVCTVNEHSEFVLTLDQELAKAHRAIYMLKGGTIHASDCRFKQGFIAIETFNGGTIDVANCVFDNIRRNAIALDQANATVRDCSFELAGATANIACVGSKLQMSKVTMLGVAQQRSAGKFVGNGKIAVQALPKVDKDSKKLLARSEVVVDDSEFNTFGEDAIKIQMGTKLTANNCRFVKCGREAILADGQCIVRVNKPIFDPSANVKILTLGKNSKGEITGPISQTNFFSDATSTIIAPELRKEA